MYNLLSNSVKYSSPDRRPEITIVTREEDDYVVLWVKDNGLGISKENLPKMFTLFKRFHSHVDGTGMGLYIIKRMMDNAGGSIEVESEEGKGTEFRLYFKKEIPKPEIAFQEKQFTNSSANIVVWQQIGIGTQIVTCCYKKGKAPSS